MAFYTQGFNCSHERAGHVFQGWYKAILVEKESCLLELSRYIVLNPVRAGLVNTAKDWRGAERLQGNSWENKNIGFFMHRLVSGFSW